MVRQIRKAGGRDDSDDDNDDGGKAPKSKPNPVAAQTKAPTGGHQQDGYKKQKPVVFSGYDDEDAEEYGGGGASGIEAQSKLSKFKKIRQAPDAAKVMQQEPQTAPASYQSSASSYTLDSLQELRQSQKFAAQARGDKAQEAMAEMEGMELQGEEAESLEERLAYDGPNGDDAMLQSAKSDSRNGHRATNLTDPDLMDVDGLQRVSMTRREQAREFVPVEAGQTTEWEAELIRRGGNIGAGSGVSGSSSSSSSSSNNSSGSRPGQAFGGDIHSSIGEIRRALVQARQGLSDSTTAATHRLAQLRAAHDQAAHDAAAGSAELPAQVAQLNALRLFRVFIAEVVGMLRDKADMAQQLQAALAGFMRNCREGLRATRVERQEDEWYTVTQGQQGAALLGLGGYAPSAVLREVAALQGYGGGVADVDAFGRSARRDGPVARQELAQRVAERAVQRQAVSLDLPAVLELSAEDQGYASDCSPARAQRDEWLAKADTLHRAAQVVMEDVRPEVGSLQEVLGRLAEFRSAQRERYKAAYMALSLPPIVAPFVLMDMLEDPPLAPAGSGVPVTALRERAWFRAVRGYSQVAGAAAECGEASAVVDEDSSLLAKVLALGPLPLLVQMSAGLDPLCLIHAEQCVDWLDCLEGPDVGGALATQPLWSAVFGQFEDTLVGPAGELSLVPPEGRGAGGAFVCSQLRRATVALGHLCLFKRLHLRTSPPAAGPDGHGFIARVALQACLQRLPACSALLEAADCPSPTMEGSSAAPPRARQAVWALLRVITKLVPGSLVVGLCRPDVGARFERLRAVVGVGRGIEAGREGELRAIMGGMV